MVKLMKDHDTGLIALCNANLDLLPEDILHPIYDRSAITPGIVHIGMGNFHRAHQAWYLHRLMGLGLALDWGIIGAGVMPEDRAQRDRLAAQDYLTTLIELDPSGTRAEVIGSIVDFVPVAVGNGPLIQQLADPAIRIVSLTVTEGGYFLDPATKRFDPTHADIEYDAAHIDTPRTAFGAIVAALKIRRARGVGAFTCQSCDNLPGNGTILRAVVTGLAHLVDADLGDWIAQNVSFPNSMVDCIVPATGPKELALARKLGLDDAAPVTHENFRQWVMEDDFCAGRPPWEQAGATMSDRVHDFEAMKLRILNGGHQIIANPAEILGLATIADAMAHPLIKQTFRKIALHDIAPHVPPVPGMTQADYVDLIDRRFSNPAIHDTVRRVAFDGSSRHTGAVLPVIRDAIAANADLTGLALSQALWARMCTGQRDDGTLIESNDPDWANLHAAAQAAVTDPGVWLDQRQYYGDIADSQAFRDAFAHMLGQLTAHGVESTLKQFVG